MDDKLKIECNTESMEAIESGEISHVHSVPIPETTDVDEGYDLALRGQDYVIDPIAEKKVLRKIDYILMPLACCMMSCLLMDKSTTSYASIMGLRADLNMSLREYSWVGSCYYLGYLGFEYSANLVLQKYPLGKVMALAIIGWGSVVCLSAVAFNAASFLVCRVFLGIFESFVHPGLMMVMYQWYKKDEQFIRSSLWLGLQGFGTAVGSALAYGLYVHQDSFSIPGWKILFIITGLMTVVMGFLTFFFPDSPTTARFLSEEEKILCIERVKDNRTGVGNKHFKPYQFKEALTDSTMYLYFFYMLGYGIANGALGTFGSILFDERFAFSTEMSLLLNLPGSLIDIIFPFAFALIAKYVVKSRLVVSMFISVANFVGLCLLAFALDSRAAMMFGYYITYWATAGWACMSSLISSNVAGHTKKVTFNALFLIGFAAGNIIGPQTYVESEAPDYKSSAYTLVGTSIVQTLAPFILMIIYYFRNKKKVEISEVADNYKEDVKLSFGDLTDMENPVFKYSL